MDPSTGTFISMDSYAGTIYDPVSLHKYLYANANPVMNTDPSGYFSLSECMVTVGQKISMVNQKIHEIKTLQKMMNTANALCTAYDMLTMMKEVWLGERSIVDVALVLLRGIAIGYLINCACGTQLGVVLKPVLGALGVKSNVDELVEAINNRDVVEIVVRSVQLVCAIFGLTAQCFTGDTLISAENGLVPIEDIKVGDLVWTENIETDEQELKEVTKVYVNKTDKILHLTIEKEGDIETIDTTEGHPFYVEGKGWVRAGVLQKGDVLTSETGNAVVVSKQTENLSVPVIIYNLEVTDNHTYFVSEEKVLVHNSGNSGCSVETSADSEGGSDTKPFDVVEYGDKTPGLENHHGVLDVWATHNIDGYKSRASKSTTMALTKSQHDATKSVFRDWLFERTGKKVGAKVDWENVTPREIQLLCEMMFDAANVPISARENYYRDFHSYIYGLE